MTQVEKARAYEEALERARLSRLQLLDIGEEATEIEYIFPELKEESEDEKIRKELITHCRNTRCVTEEGAERIAKWIAWLEKQDPKKHEEELENAYKAGAQWQKKHLFDNRIKDCNNITEEQYNLESDFLDGFIDKHDRMPTFLDAIEYGMNYKKK